MDGHKKTVRQRRVRSLIKALRSTYPDAGMILRYSNHWELLVSVMLSAQCTDKKVNEVTRTLFKKYKTLDDYLTALPKAFEQDIFSTGFYRNKTKNVLAAARAVSSDFGGAVPDSMDSLLLIPGVARKTANVVLGNAFGKVEGIAVDTHVRRFAIRFDLSDSKNSDHIEKDLMEIIPRKDWFSFTYLVIEYGRAVKGLKFADPLVSIFPEAATRWNLAKKI